MSAEPKRLTIKLGDIMDTMERVYMVQRKRGFLRPRPNMPEAGDPRLEGIPDAFLEWWKTNRNCDMSPVVAWKVKGYRDRFFKFQSGDLSTRSDYD